jgi:hypothetical protein
MKCIGCNSPNIVTFIDLGHMPISNSLPKDKNSDQHNNVFELHAKLCLQCSLVQLNHGITAIELFPADYVYFSSYSSSWLQHSQTFANEIIEELSLTNSELVVEVASNDGYLLQYFLENGLRVYGIEPAFGVASSAIEKGIPTCVEFFTHELALKLKKNGICPKLIVGNNVLAHVPDLKDFIRGISVLLDDECVATFEFPLLLNLIRNIQFDTIYHEHFYYLSLTALVPIFKKHGMEIFKATQIPTHGGSVRIYVKKTSSSRPIDLSVQSMLDLESKFDPRQKSVLENFRQKTYLIRQNLLSEIAKLSSQSLSIAAYGAAAKGNTLLNFCGITHKEISYVADLNVNKQSRFLPGSQIPIYNLEYLLANPPDVLLVLPWNLSEEIKIQLSIPELARTKFLRAIPEVGYF